MKILLNGHSIIKILITANSSILNSQRQFVSYIWKDLVLILAVLPSKSMSLSLVFPYL